MDMDKLWTALVMIIAGGACTIVGRYLRSEYRRVFGGRSSAAES